MPSERDHHASKENAFEIVVIPQGDTGSTRSFKASVLTIMLACVGIVTLIASLTIATIIYTPAGLLLPMSEEQLQKRYGSELFEVQKRLNRITSEVLVLREYNNKLRNALGQKTLPEDSTFNLGSVASLMSEQESAVADVPITANNQQQATASSSVIVYRPAVNIRNDEATFRAEFPIIAPAVGYVSRRYESEKGHIGIDYAGKIGSLIVAAADGYVVFSGFTIDDGHTVMLSHGGGYLTIYKHNQNVLKGIGEFVKRGEPIALLGNSGRTSFGPHLHFEIWNNGRAQNPNDYLIASEL
ncbi:MAG: M23 family metallopeptidase [Bacteroidota bacterium]|jgi:murein DD-endopeptidase MepM/ murein hydrolase activator NlpD